MPFELFMFCCKGVGTKFFVWFVRKFGLIPHPDVEFLSKDNKNVIYNENRDTYITLRC